MPKRSIIMMVSVLAALLVLGGCAALSGGTQKETADQAYKVLRAGAIFYAEALGAAADLYLLGLIDEGQKQEVIKVGDRYRVAWQAAANALHVYAVAEVPDRAGLEQQLTLFRLVYEELTDLARPYLIRALAKKQEAAHGR